MRRPPLEERLPLDIRRLERELAAPAATADAHLRRDRVALALDGLRLAHLALSGARVRESAPDPSVARLRPIEARLMAILTLEGPCWLRDIASRFQLPRRQVGEIVRGLAAAGRVVTRQRARGRCVALRLGL